MNLTSTLSCGGCAFFYVVGAGCIRRVGPHPTHPLVHKRIPLDTERVCLSALEPRALRAAHATPPLQVDGATK